MQNRSGNISGSDEAGDTRDIAAAKAGLGSGKTLEDALKVERDENDQRKEPTVSEKVALAEAITERLQGRQGTGPAKRGGNISTSSDDTGKTRDIAAAKAGLGSGPSAASCASPHGPGSGEGGSIGIG